MGRFAPQIGIWLLLFRRLCLSFSLSYFVRARSTQSPPPFLTSPGTTPPLFLHTPYTDVFRWLFIRYLQDGEVHVAKIEYTPGLDFNPEEQPHWSSTPFLQQFVKSDGIGTLRVWVDDMDTAVINMPLSLKYALKLTDGAAMVGFTAATGSMWQNHDLIDWSFVQYSPNPDSDCPPQLEARSTCLAEKRWSTFAGAELSGTPFFEPGGEPWSPSRGSVCTTCP